MKTHDPGTELYRIVTLPQNLRNHNKSKDRFNNKIAFELHWVSCGA